MGNARPGGLVDALRNCDRISAELERRKALGLPYPTLDEIDCLLGRKPRNRSQIT